MMLRQLIEGGVDNLHILTHNRLSYICYFLRSLIDKKDDKIYLRIIGLNRISYFLKEGGLTCLRRRYNHTSLTLTDRTEDIHDSHGYGTTLCLKLYLLIGEDRC